MLIFWYPFFENVPKIWNGLFGKLESQHREWNCTTRQYPSDCLGFQPLLSVEKILKLSSANFWIIWNQFCFFQFFIDNNCQSCKQGDPNQNWIQRVLQSCVLHELHILFVMNIRDFHVACGTQVPKANCSLAMIKYCLSFKELALLRR